MCIICFLKTQMWSELTVWNAFCSLVMQTSRSELIIPGFNKERDYPSLTPSRSDCPRSGIRLVFQRDSIFGGWAVFLVQYLWEYDKYPVDYLQLWVSQVCFLAKLMQNWNAKRIQKSTLFCYCYKILHWNKYRISVLPCCCKHLIYFYVNHCNF